MDSTGGISNRATANCSTSASSSTGQGSAGILSQVQLAKLKDSAQDLFDKESWHLTWQLYGWKEGTCEYILVSHMIKIADLTEDVETMLAMNRLRNEPMSVSTDILTPNYIIDRDIITSHVRKLRGNGEIQAVGEHFVRYSWEDWLTVLQTANYKLLEAKRNAVPPGWALEAIENRTADPETWRFTTLAYILLQDHFKPKVLRRA